MNIRLSCTNLENIVGMEAIRLSLNVKRVPMNSSFKIQTKGEFYKVNTMHI
ncbi:hypothetical protein Hanom_Chr07g00597941 [Helianthus anomalus]